MKCDEVANKIDNYKKEKQESDRALTGIQEKLENGKSLCLLF